MKRDRNISKIMRHTSKLRWGFAMVLLPFLGTAQDDSKVSSEIDTTSIKIGEQIQYKITVETDSTNIVHFPE